MNFIIKNKKTIIISAVAATALVLAIVLGIVIGNLIGNSPKNILKKIAQTASEFDADQYVCNIEYLSGGVTLKGEYTLTLIESDGEKHAELSYKYDKLNTVGESDEFISEISGTLYARGEDEVGELKDSAIVWESGVVPSKISLLELSYDVFESFSAKNEDGKLFLEGVLLKDILGKGISNAKMTVSCHAKDPKAISITLEYTDEYGARVQAGYEYSLVVSK